MRPPLWIAAAGLCLAACEPVAPAKPAAEQPGQAAVAPPPAETTRPRPNLRWDPKDVQGMAAAVSPCAAKGVEWFDQEPASTRKTGRAVRSGKTLTAGKATFVDRQDGDDDSWMVLHTYLGAYGDSNVDAVLLSYYEGTDVMLVDQRNGESFGFIDLPLASPDGRFFAAASTSEYEGYGVQIVERTPAGWVERGNYDEKVLIGPCGLTWKSNTVLALQVRWPTDVPDEVFEWSPQTAGAWGPARVVRTDDAWRYEPPRR